MTTTRRASSNSLAQRADKYALYQQSVQAPENEVAFFARAYRDAYRTRAHMLREDFCGTAAVCCAWVSSDRRRQAIGVDLDPAPLRWGQEHNLSTLTQTQRDRITLLQQDVRVVAEPAADVVAAQNFSFYTFKTRAELLGYFSAARSNLADKGVLVLDMMGGPQIWEEDRIESRRVAGARYRWEHERFDPITHHCRFAIHFAFRDGSELRRAFHYDWRLWTIPEVRELLEEAGFRQSAVYWEGTDGESGSGNGVFRRRKQAPSDPAWVTYVVGIK